MPNPLHTLAANPKTSSKELASQVESKKFDINERDIVSGKRPIEFAVQSGSYEAVIYLIETAKVNINSQNKIKNLIDYAKLNPDPKVLKYVCQPHIVSKFEDGTTALHAAALLGDAGKVMQAIENDPPQLFAVNSHGETALDIAIRENHPLIVMRIITHNDFARHANTNKLDNAYIYDLQQIAKKVETLHKETKLEDPTALVAKVEATIATAEKSVLKKEAKYYLALAAAHMAKFDAYRQHEFKDYADVTKCIKYADEALACFKRFVTVPGSDDSYQRAHLNAVYQLKRADLIKRHPNPKLNRLEQLTALASEYRASLVQLDLLQTKILKRTIEDLENLQLAYARLVETLDEMHLFTQDSLHKNHSKRFAELQTTLTHEISVQREFDAIAKLWGLTRVDVPGEGNCFFHAVADQIQSQGVGRHLDKSAQQYRKLAVDRVAKYPAYYGAFMEGMDTPVKNAQKYVRKMNRNGEWADAHAINALARKLHMVIFIVYSDGSAPTILKPKKSEGALFLFYDKSLRHYQSLRFNPEIVATFSAAEAIESTKPMEAEPKPAKSSTAKLLPSLEAKQELPASEKQDTQPTQQIVLPGIAAPIDLKTLIASMSKFAVESKFNPRPPEQPASNANTEQQTPGQTNGPGAS